MATLTSWLSMVDPVVQPGQPSHSGNPSELIQLIPYSALAAVVLYILKQLSDSRKERKAEDKELRLKHRSVLLRRMWQYVDGLLSELVDSDRRIPITYQHKSELVTARWRGDAGGAWAGRPDLGPDASIMELFDASQTLLILGEPGGGKTTWMLELARELLKRSDADQEAPLPVVLSVLPWAETWVTRRQRGLDNWLVSQLSSSYGQSRGVASWWIRNGEVAFLLDDLDRLEPAPREAFVTQVNEYMVRHPAAPLVVCCRASEYEEMSSRLHVDDAVRIERPTRQQVYDYLELAGTSFRRVQAAVGAGDNDDALWDLLRSPLMLSVVADVLHEGALESIQVGRPEEGRARLFELYISKAFSGSNTQSNYSRARVVRWLGWLASAMEWSHLSEFRLDRLGRCYPTTRVGKVLALPVVFLVSGLASLAAIWCLSAVLEVITYVDATQVLHLPHGPFFPLLLVETRLDQPELMFLTGGFLGAAVYLNRRKVRLWTFEWSWAAVLSMIIGVAFTIAMYYVLIFIGHWLEWSLLWILNVDIPESARTSYTDARETVDRIADFPTFIAMGLTFGFLMGSLADYDERLQSQTGLSASAGIKRSGWTGFIAGLTFIVAWVLTYSTNLLYAIVVKHSYYFPFDLPHTLKTALGLLFIWRLHLLDMTGAILFLLFLVTSFGGGVWLQHQLFRMLLMVQHRAPIRYSRFLNDAGTRSILRPTENGLIFFHDLMQQYICEAYGPRVARHKHLAHVSKDIPQRVPGKAQERNGESKVR